MGKLGMVWGPDCGLNVAAAMGVGAGREEPVVQCSGSDVGWGSTNSGFWSLEVRREV